MLFPHLTENSRVFKDERGHVQLLYETDQMVLKRSFSKQGVLRGLHRQTFPHLQEKIIRVISGRIYDFVTDPDNPNDSIWYTEITPNDQWIHIPANLAHGFYAIEDVNFEYFCEGGYNEQAEESWSIVTQVVELIGNFPLHVSSKDKNGKPLTRPLRHV